MEPEERQVGGNVTEFQQGVIVGIVFLLLGMYALRQIAQILR